MSSCKSVGTNYSPHRKTSYVWRVKQHCLRRLADNNLQGPGANTCFDKLLGRDSSSHISETQNFLLKWKSGVFSTTFPEWILIKREKQKRFPLLKNCAQKGVLYICPVYRDSHSRYGRQKKSAQKQKWPFLVGQSLLWYGFIIVQEIYVQFGCQTLAVFEV